MDRFGIGSSTQVAVEVIAPALVYVGVIAVLLNQVAIAAGFAA